MTKSETNAKIKELVSRVKESKMIIADYPNSNHEYMQRSIDSLNQKISKLSGLNIWR